MTDVGKRAQYDDFAADYQRTKEAPLRRYVEAYTFMQMIGDVHGLRVLDLACGDGYYSRRIRSAGAAQVTGVDVSAEMIALAEREEHAAPLGIEYRVADVADLKLADLNPADLNPVDLNPADQNRQPACDLVSAAYLLHYAPDAATLRTMCERIAACLQPGGRFVAINENPDQPDGREPGYAQYGFDKAFSRPRGDGSRIDYTMVSGRQMLRFHVWYYSRAVYEGALKAAGFTTVRWLPLQLDPAGIDACGAEYWQAYMNNPPVIGLEAVR